MYRKRWPHVSEPLRRIPGGTRRTLLPPIMHNPLRSATSPNTHLGTAVETGLPADRESGTLMFSRPGHGSAPHPLLVFGLRGVAGDAAGVRELNQRQHDIN